MHFWSGFLVRPAEGVCLRVGPAFNRRSRVSVLDHAIVDRSGFTPLMLEIDGRDLGREPRWISGEIGCVLPVAAQTRMTLAPIQRAPEVVKAFESFFDGHYFEAKKVKPTGKYRRSIRMEPARGEAAACEARVFYAGPAIHSVSQLDRFHGPLGIERGAQAGVSIPICTVRNVGRVEAEWDGQTFTRDKKSLAGALRSLKSDWVRAGGDVAGDAYEFLSGYFFGPGRDEPYWLLQPWVFAVTPPGWSTVIDGAPVAGCDGMRGIVRTDNFHPVSMVYRLYAPGPVTVPRGAPMLRFGSLPRRLQGAQMRIIS